MTSYFPIPYVKTNTRSTTIPPTLQTTTCTITPAPKLYYLIGNSARGWEITRPLQVQVEHTDGEFITSELRFNVYGVGETWAESLADFTSMLVDLFEELSASQDVLSPHLGEQLESLRAILSPC